MYNFRHDVKHKNFSAEFVGYLLKLLHPTNKFKKFLSL